ncbi:MAG: hypothetical protein LBL66_07070 [Clostridiales bacterium]|nr:hypothetical protein [Clostridiales bacterium]
MTRGYGAFPCSVEIAASRFALLAMTGGNAVTPSEWHRARAAVAFRLRLFRRA